MRNLFFLILLFIGCTVLKDVPETPSIPDVSVSAAPSNQMIVVDNGKSGFKSIPDVLDSNDVARHSDTLTTLATKNEIASFVVDSEVIQVVDSIEQILTNTYELNQLVRDKQNGGLYQIQADSIAGYVTDSIGVIPLDVGYAILQPDQDGFYNVFHFGVDTSVTDNSPPFQASYDFSKLFNGMLKVDKPGVYRFNQEITDITVANDIYIKGEGNVIFQVDNQEWGHFTNNIEPEYPIDSLLYDNVKGTFQFKIRNADQLARGDLIAIEQSDMVGTFATKRELIEVATILNDSTIMTLDSLLFNHADTNTVTVLRVYKKRSFNIENIKFDFRYNYVSTGSMAISVQGFNGVNVIDVEFINDTYDSQLLDGISMYGCSNIHFKDTKYRNLRYGSLINVSDRVRIINSYAEDVRHLSAITTWTKNVYVSDAIGYRCRALIEAHYGWNVHYNNIWSDQHGKLTLRSFGDLKITNSYIKTDDTEDRSTIYTLIGLHFANTEVNGTEFEWLVDETDILIDNVEYIENLDSVGSFTGLTATGFKTLTINNSTAATMGGYENGVVEGSTVRISNSRLGFLQSRDGGELVTMDNVIFDGDIHPGTGSIISHGQADTLIIRNALFINTDSLHIESNWQANGAAGLEGEYQFHSVSGTLKSPADTVSTNAIATAKPMKFFNSDVNFVDTIIPVRHTQNTETFFELSNSSLNWSDVSLHDTYRQHTEGDEYFSFYNSANQKVRIDSLGLTLNQSPGGYNAGITNKDPVSGLLDNDLHLYAVDAIEFHGTSGSVDLGFWNNLAFQTNVRIATNIDPVDIHSISNETFTIRAGDGNPVRTADIEFLVKDDILVGEFRDDGTTVIGNTTLLGSNFIYGSAFEWNSTVGKVNFATNNNIGAIQLRNSANSIIFDITNGGTTKIRNRTSLGLDFETNDIVRFGISAGGNTFTRNDDDTDYVLFSDAAAEEVRVGGNTDNGAYEFQVNGDEYVSGSTTYGVSGEGINFVDAGQSVTATTAGIDVGLPSGDAFTVATTETNDDPNWVVTQARVATTDATPTTLLTIPITASRTYMIKAIVLARRTGGTAGTADDGGAYKLEYAYTTKAGIVTVLASNFVDNSKEDVVAYDVNFVISGANVLVQVIGVLDTNITWHCTTEVSYVGT